MIWYGQARLGVWSAQCRSKVDYELIEKVRGRDTNTVSGLELHMSVLSPAEQVQMVETIERWVASGKRGEMSGRTFSAPRRSMPGKGRITCQFGCCYNYAVDQQGRKPGRSLPSFSCALISNCCPLHTARALLLSPYISFHCLPSTAGVARCRPDSKASWS